MKPKHSPGPWHISHSPKFGEPFITSATGKCTLAGMIGGGSLDQIKANARLIASSPALADMIRALRDAAINTPALDSSEDWSALIAQADQTLSEATGEARLFN